MKVVVRGVENPQEGQMELDENQELAVFCKGQWISKDEYDRGIYIRLLETGDCV